MSMDERAAPLAWPLFDHIEYGGPQIDEVTNGRARSASSAIRGEFSDTLANKQPVPRGLPR
jgi:hypothetical protein